MVKLPNYSAEWTYSAMQQFYKSGADFAQMCAKAARDRAFRCFCEIKEKAPAGAFP
jgi:hypothetical protein